LIAPGPTDLRSLFTLFLLYDPTTGIEGLVKRVDLTGFEPRIIYHAVLGRNPENAAVCRPHEAYDVYYHLWEALQSEEFQYNVLELILRAFPDRKRVIFVHIPKCAGTDLISKVLHKYPSINNTLTSRTWTTTPQLFEALKEIISGIYCSGALFAYGHVALPWLLDHGILRLQDDCFTIVRAPFDMVLSQVNYILTRIFAARDLGTAPDVQAWLSRLGFDRIPLDVSRAEALNLAKSVLRNEKLTPSNIITKQLGVSHLDPESNAASAINNLVVSNIEITDTIRYDSWSQRKFGHAEATRTNQSDQILTPEDLSPADREYISAITAEDQIVYDTIMKVLESSDSLSIHGGDL
jgi:hypothetical protein